MIKKEFLTFKETCTMLNVGEHLLRKLVFEKSIPYYKFGRALRFKLTELDDWVLSRKIGVKRG